MTLRRAARRSRPGARIRSIDAGRQMVEQVDDPRQVEPLQQLGDLRPDALQRLHLGEQRVEDFRAHDGC